MRCLLQFHAMLGGSAILMTATLPAAMRNGYAKAFQKGHGVHLPSSVLGNAYPMLSVIGSEIYTAEPDPAPLTCRDIAIHRLADTRAAMKLLGTGVKGGAACVWIRNTVDNAITAVAALLDQGIEADLLHARYTVADRLNKEALLHARFGRHGVGREGRVLVATQVVEASLDLDFDLMVSDLAPIGSLIQRAGRMWRHMDLRPAQDRPVSGPSLHVLAPDPGHVEDGKWLSRCLGTGALIYPLDQQWRTARALFEKGTIRMPGGLRDLIDSVYGNDLLDVPEALESAEIENYAHQIVEYQQAANQLLDPDDAYDQPQMARVFDDERFPTRLGIPQVILRLARRASGQLVPWAGDGPYGWQSSEVRVSAVRYLQLPGVDQNQREIAALREHWPSWMQSSVYVSPVEEDGRICDGLRYDNVRGVVFGDLAD